MGYRIDGKLDAAGKNEIKPFTYTRPQIGAPEFSSYPIRLVVSSGVSDDPESQQLGVWQRLNAGTPCVLTHSVYPGAATKLPSMEGLRTPAKADLAKLSTLPQTAGNLHQDYLHQVAVVIPPKGSATKTRILSLDGQLVGAGGS